MVYLSLKALEQLHSCNYCHGDIKSENLVVTSWNWLFLTDFASYKPTYITEDGLSLFFSYFFESHGRERCYIAPERIRKEYFKYINSVNNVTLPSEFGEADKNYTNKKDNGLLYYIIILLDQVWIYFHWVVLLLNYLWMVNHYLI